MPSLSPPAASAGQQQPKPVPRLLVNTGWNVAGQIIPMAVGIAVVPLLIRTLGLDRYGFLTLVWVLVGYASIFDFGIGRVLIRIMSLRLARADLDGAQHVARVGLTFLCIFGLLVGLAFSLGSVWLSANVVKMPPELQDEALRAMWLLGASIPFVMLTTGYTGILSAHQQFRGLNIVRAAMGVASYVGPLLVALWINRLDAVLAYTLLMRMVAALVHAELARRSCGFSYVPLVPDRVTTRELLALGGWVSVSNMVSPMLSYLDRLLLGALVPIRMVAFYATPFDLVNRATLLPSALMGALFPSAAAVEPGSVAARTMLTQSARLLFTLSFPFAFGFIVMAAPGLRLWLGDDFAARAAPVLQLLALGVFFNTMAQAPAVLIQAAGQPRVMALLHLVELPVFVAVLYALTSQLGIVGTALAACLRNGADAIAVLVLARRDVARGRLQWRLAVVPCTSALVLLAAAVWPHTAPQSLAVLAFGLLAFCCLAWQLLLLPKERQHLLGLLGRRR